MSTTTVGRTCQKPKEFSMSLLGYETIERLATRIKPVCRKIVNGNEGLWYIFIDELWNTALTVSPIAVVKASELRLLETIITCHKPLMTNDGKMFMPSAAEVLSQIPNEFLGKIVAYEITQRGVTDKIVVISDKDRPALNAGWFLAEVKLYAKK